MEVTVRIPLCVFALVAATACADSLTPSSPSRASAAADLRWDVMATSATCGAVTPPSPQPSFSAAALTNEPDGSLTASWPYQVNGRDVRLYARFIRENGSWAMCSWDTADV
jgi:hypothetical protein